MRINVFKSGGHSGQGGFVSNGLTLQGPLILSGPHSEPLHAVPKQYVDNLAYNLNANNITSGTLPAGRLPAFTGDATTILGTSNINLSNTGILPGSIVKPTVDAKGRVISSGTLLPSDISAIGFNKITVNKPTTLSGYGIMDGVKLNTDNTIQGNLILYSNATDANHAVTKQQVDSAAGQAGGISVGDIIRKPYTTTPAGFLKCNGAEVDKTMYANLYSVIGDTFANDLTVGSGRPWQQQYQFNTTQFADVLGWVSTTSLPGILCHSSIIATKNRVYMLGGFNGTAYLSTVYTAPINSDGTLGTWTTGTSLPITLLGSSAFVTTNRVYLVGGVTGTGTYISSVYSAPIHSDGSLGTWVQNANSLPGVLGYSRIVVTKNRVYTIAGYNGSSNISTVYTTTINDDGSINSWSVHGTVPNAVHLCNLAVIKDRLYIFGGYNGSVGISSVYYANIDSSGIIGAWIPGVFLPKGMSHGECFVTKNKVFLINANEVWTSIINTDGSLGTWYLSARLPFTTGDTKCVVTSSKVYLISSTGSGYSGNIAMGDMSGGMNDYSSFYSDITETNNVIPGSGRPWQQQYQINTTQSADITGWSTSAALPVSLSVPQAIVTKNRIYLIAGKVGASPSSSVYTAVINSDGTINNWLTATSLPVALMGTQAIITKNRVYLIGGHTGTNVVSTVYTAPINSDGTLGTWTTSNSLPNAVSGTQAIVTKNRVYLLGGSNANTGLSAISTVYTTTIALDGTLGTWTTAPNLPVALYGATAVVTKNRVYLCSGTTDTGYVSTVYTAVINNDGTLGAWAASTSLPEVLYASQPLVTKNRVYLLGGANATQDTRNVYAANINSDGTLGTWTLMPTILLGGVHWSQSVVVSNRIYLIGAWNNNLGSSTVYTANISGGLNDYSPYYDGTNDLIDATINYMMPGSGRPWQQQYAINETQTGDITGWTSATLLPGILAFTSAVATKNRVYLLGGVTTGGTAVSTVYTAPINSDGTLGTWGTGTSLPQNFSRSQSIVTKNRVYLLAGHNGTSYVTTVYTAPINSDGTLGTWTTDPNALPAAFGHTHAIQTKNRAYLFGGFNSSSITNCYTAVINSDGTLGPWVTSPSLPAAVSAGQIVVTKNRLYLLGGTNGTAAVSTIYTTTVNSDGTIGLWTSSGSLPIAIASCGVFVSKNNIYLIGGYSGDMLVSISSVYRAPINSDGTLGAWVTGTSLPGIFSRTQSIVTKNRIYLCGGFTNNTYSSTVYTASISEGLNDYSPYYDGTIQPVSTVSSKFKLPDYSLADREFGEHLTSYIKF